MVPASAALSGGGAVTFTCTGTILALNDPITINADTTIIGNYRVTIDGGGVAQLFVNKPGVKLTLENLSFTGATDQYASNSNLAAAFVHNQGTLVVKNCRFTRSGPIRTGAIVNDDGAALDVRQSTFFQMDFGSKVNGTVISMVGGSALVSNSTFFNNLSNNSSGIKITSGITGGGKMTITNSTFFHSGAVTVEPGSTAVLQNTIIAYGAPNCSGTGLITDGGGNLRSPGPPGDTSCSGVGSVADPQFTPASNPFQNNGGFTETLALSGTSPAIDTAVDALCPPTDQRGKLRPQGAHCDIGAFEYSTPLSVFSSVLRDLDTFTIASLLASQHLQNAIIDPLSRSLNLNFWQGTDHLVAAHGSEVFAMHEDVVNSMNNLTLDATQLAYIQNVVSGDRSLAQVAITDAHCLPDLQNAGAGVCARANSELAAGDASAANGQFGQSVEHYANAWRAVVTNGQ